MVKVKLIMIIMMTYFYLRIHNWKKIVLPATKNYMKWKVNTCCRMRLKKSNKIAYFVWVAE